MFETGKPSKGINLSLSIMRLYYTGDALHVYVRVTSKNRPLGFSNQLLIQAHENIIAPLGGDLSIKHN